MTDAIQAVAGYSRALDVTASPASPDGDAFARLLEGFADTLQRGEAQAMTALTDRADPHALVTALAQTELAVEAAVSVRDRVVEAYQELLRMPV